MTIKWTRPGADTAFHLGGRGRFFRKKLLHELVTKKVQDLHNKRGRGRPPLDKTLLTFWKFPKITVLLLSESDDNSNMK